MLANLLGQVSLNFILFLRGLPIYVLQYLEMQMSRVSFSSVSRMLANLLGQVSLNFILFLRGLPIYVLQYLEMQMSRVSFSSVSQMLANFWTWSRSRSTLFDCYAVCQSISVPGDADEPR
jgi:hypothetical protein